MVEGRGPKSPRFSGRSSSTPLFLSNDGRERVGTGRTSESHLSSPWVSEVPEIRTPYLPSPQGLRGY